MLQVFLIVIGLSVGVLANAQVPNLTAEQLQTFQQLSEEQRAAALQSLQGQSTADIQGEGVTQPVVVEPRPAAGLEQIEQPATEAIDISILGETLELRAVDQQLTQFGYVLIDRHETVQKVLY